MFLHVRLRVAPLALAVLLFAQPLRAGDSLRVKLGQMLMLGFIGPVVTDSLAVDLSQRNLGGIVVLASNGNLPDPPRIRALTAAIRAAAPVPPFIAVDQEGGRVARLSASNGFAATLSAYTLGTVYASVDSTRAQAQLMAGWLADCGLNVNLAPVVDVNVNPSSPAIGYYGRSFSADPAVVAAHSAAFIDAFHDRGIVTATKHFPGHGSATTDSHLSLPDITQTWSDDELSPYRHLIAADRLDMVMIGHLYNALLDGVYPTSLSHSTITGLLRDSLGFAGVVVSDAMFMGAITEGYGVWDAAELAVNAGTDILLYTSSIYNGRSLAGQLIDTLASRVAQGRISEARVDEAYNRIMALKRRYLITGVSAPVATAAPIPEGYDIANYPNPFNPSTTVRVSLPVRSRVSLEVYDILGRLVERLYEGEAAPGILEASWRARGGSGVYFCRIDARPVDGSHKAFSGVRKMVVVQ